MRVKLVLALLTAITSFFGCSPEAPSVANNSQGLSPGDEIPGTERDAPEFDPKLSITWPGAPKESRRRIDAGTIHETSIYSASFSRSDPATIFAASVHQDSEQDVLATDPKQLLVENALSDDEVELSREEFEHGPHKHPGLDVTAKSGDGYVRRLVVLAGTRTYNVSVTSTKEERLKAEDVTTFFESFKIED